MQFCRGDLYTGATAFRRLQGDPVLKISTKASTPKRVAAKTSNAKPRSAAGTGKTAAATKKTPATRAAATKGRASAVRSKPSATGSARPSARKAPAKSAKPASARKLPGLAKAAKVSADQSGPGPFAPEVASLRRHVINALEDLKAKDVKEIDIRGKASFADLLVIASGTSTRHVKSLADEVVRFVKKAGMMPLGVEGEREAEWVLVDLGDIVCHLMLPRIRDFYALESMWSVDGDAPVMDA